MDRKSYAYTLQYLLQMLEMFQNSRPVTIKTVISWIVIWNIKMKIILKNLFRNYKIKVQNVFWRQAQNYVYHSRELLKAHFYARKGKEINWSSPQITLK